MATEEQELRLRVVLDDQASAALAALRGNIAQLTSGQAAASFEKFKRSQAEIGEGIKKLIELSTGGERALLSFIGKFGAFGVAAAGLGTVLTSTALKMADLADKAKLTGIEPARLKSFVDQLEKAGVASDVAADSAGRFAGALADLSRFGSQRYQALINMAGTHKAEMIAGIREVQNAATIEEKFNKARELAENVAKHRHDDTLRRTHDSTTADADAAKAKLEFYQKLTDMDPSTTLLRHMENLTAEEKKRFDELLANGRRVKTAFDELKKSSELVGESLLKAFGPGLAKILAQDAKDIEAIVKLLERIEQWWARTGGLDKGGSYTSPGKTGRPAQPDLRKQGLDMLRRGEGTRLAPEGSSVGPGTGKGATEAPPPQGGAAPQSQGAAAGDRAPQGAPQQGAPTQGAPQPQKPNGSSVGPGTGKGATETPPPQGGSAPTGAAGPAPRGRGAAETSGDAVTTAQDGSKSLAEQRQQHIKELNDNPQLRDFAIDAMQHEGGVQSNLEQLFNYASMRGMTINQALHSGQYGPVKHHLISGRLSEAQRRRGLAALGKVGAGSNITDYATDQGMAGDPNFAKYMSNRSYYGMHKVEGAWFSAHGEQGRHWAARQRAADANIKAAEVNSRAQIKGAELGPMSERYSAQRLAEESEAAPRITVRPYTGESSESNRKVLDDKAAQGVNVNATGKLAVDVNAPAGTKVRAEGDGLFKKTEVNRQTQMQPAADGPLATQPPM
jgi:hypothetical protein